MDGAEGFEAKSEPSMFYKDVNIAPSRAKGISNLLSKEQFEYFAGTSSEEEEVLELPPSMTKRFVHDRDRHNVPEELYDRPSNQSSPYPEREFISSRTSPSRADWSHGAETLHGASSSSIGSPTLNMSAYGTQAPLRALKHGLPPTSQYGTLYEQQMAPGITSMPGVGTGTGAVAQSYPSISPTVEGGDTARMVTISDIELRRWEQSQRRVNFGVLSLVKGACKALPARFRLDREGRAIHAERQKRLMTMRLEEERRREDRTRVREQRRMHPLRLKEEKRWERQQERAAARARRDGGAAESPSPAVMLVPLSGTSHGRPIHTSALR